MDVQQRHSLQTQRKQSWSWLYGISICILIIGGGAYVNKNRVTCTTSSIPYTTITNNDPDLYQGNSEVTTDGTDGTKQTCVRKNGDVVSTSTVTEPVTKVVNVGTKQFIVYTPPAHTSGCVVTTCNDGTCSYSTGRGTCSWHGGVAYYN